MGLSLRWVGEEERERVAQTRLLCYSPAASMIEKYRDSVRADIRAQPRHFLLADLDGQSVGTTTSLDLTMWVRGTPLPCQGVAYVGTIKTHRRISHGPAKGIATQLMAETLRFARERNHVLSALMPFRVSYYEHFGYGIVENRAEWTVPLSVLPAGDFDGFRFYRDDDLLALMACHHRIIQQGQCDIERPEPVWHEYLRKANDGFLVVDRPEPNGPVHGWLTLVHANENGRDILKVADRGADSLAALVRQLNYLSSLRDQYAAATLILPADLPLNWLLKERQVPHRPVNHATASLRAYSRMQLRILDHKRFLDALHLPEEIRGSATVSIAEPEGGETRLALAFEAGRCASRTTDSAPDVSLPAATWAAVATGALRASEAARLGLIQCANPAAARALDVFAAGPRPFTHEYF